MDVRLDTLEFEEQIAAQEAAMAAPLTTLQVESLVLIQMLLGYSQDLDAKVIDHSGGGFRTLNEIAQRENFWSAKMGTEMLSVEIIWDGEIQQRYFHVPYIGKHLSTNTRETLVRDIYRGDPDLKLGDFLRRSKIIRWELVHQEQLRQLGLDQLLSPKQKNTATWLTFYINALININYMYSYKYVGENKDTLSLGDTSKMLDIGLSGIQIFLASFTLILFIIVRAPVTYQNSFAETRSSLIAFTRIFTADMTSYYIFYLVFAVLGSSLSPFFNTILLFDIMVKVPTCMDVVMAVVDPIKSLAATMVLSFFMMYMFSYLYFVEFHESFDEGECDTLWMCFKTTVTFGLRMGGGVGEHLGFNMEALTLGRFYIDLLYWFLVLIVLLNIIFGIIIDTFSERREAAKARSADTHEKCFICGIDKTEFDMLGSVAFKKHISTEHNMWAYLKYMVYIWEQDQDDDDGLESYVRRCMQKNDQNWFPKMKALRLQSAKKSQEQELMHVVEQLRQDVSVLSAAVMPMQEVISQCSEQMKSSSERKSSDSTTTRKSFVRKSAIAE